MASERLRRSAHSYLSTAASNIMGASDELHRENQARYSTRGVTHTSDGSSVAVVTSYGEETSALSQLLEHMKSA